MAIILTDYKRTNERGGWLFTIRRRGYVISPSKEAIKTILFRNNITQRSLMNMVHLGDITYGILN